MSIVVCKLPKAGLGNQLFPLLNAFVFAKLNGLKVMVIGYHQLKLGPYIRNEKSKRRYTGYFSFQKNIAGEYFDTLKIKALKRKYTNIYEPPVAKLEEEQKEGCIFIFEQMPTYHDYFIHLRDHREIVVDLLGSLVNPWIIAEVEKAKKPVIGVHIRMGDFRKLNEGEDFKGGHVRTPEHYFIDLIKQVRTIHGHSLPVSLFTDGHRHEFKALFAIDNINLIEGNADIVDMLLLSKSKVIICSSGSTFSYWAGFMSNAPLIKHPDHLHSAFRPAEINSRYYEGALLPGNVHPLLQKNIRDIKITYNTEEEKYD